MKKPKAKRFLPVSVAVLMGGESKRFGRPKAFLPYQGSSLAAGLLKKAELHSKDVFAVSRNINQVPPDARQEFPVAMDHWKERGPLSGLHAALLESNHPALFLTAVDMPYLNGKVISGFWKIFEEEGHPDVVAPRIDGYWEPLCALWNREVLKKLKSGKWGSFQKFLNEGKLNVRRVTVRELKKLDPSLKCVRNFNTPEDWKKISPTR